jgi:hypothetical protein
MPAQVCVSPVNLRDFNCWGSHPPNSRPVWSAVHHFLFSEISFLVLVVENRRRLSVYGFV